MKKIICILSTFVILIFAVETVFAQCGGTYFKTNYRAVNKIFYNGGFFMLEDWTGDGKSDFWNFQLNPKTSTQDILIFPSDPNGYWNWDTPIVYTTSIPSSVSTINNLIIIKDFNFDGRKDILVNDRIHINNGNGTFTALSPYSLEPGSNISPLGVYEVSGDNRLDWIIRTSFNGVDDIGYQAGNADGTLGARVNIWTNSDMNNATFAFGDFNGDGKTDIAYSRGNFLRILLNTGGGNFSVGNQVPITGFTRFTSNVREHSNAYIRDFNNDGRDDVLAWREGGAVDKAVIFFGQANGTLTESTISDYNGVDIKPAEMNGDNNLDIVEIRLDGSSYAVIQNNGSGNFTRTDYQKSLGERIDPNALVFEDFSGDSKADMYLDNGTTWNIFGEQVVIIKQNVCNAFGETKKPNFDNNPMPDFLMWNPNTGDWRSTNAINQFTDIKTFHWGTQGDIPAPGDFDGDGKTDYAIYRDSSGTWYINQSADSSWLVFRFGLPGDIAVPADYDGGGKTDIAVFRPSDGNWHIWFSETQQHFVMHFGTNGDKPVAADYDGDGKTDVAVFRPSEGNWYYFKSSDQNYNVIHWGISTDKPVPADYDGDGRADLAVFRDGDWYILRSLNNSFNYFHWGTSGDIPIPLYYNGNTNGEMATPYVFRPSNWNWYNYPSPFLTTFFGQSQNVPIYFGLPNN